MTAVSSGMVSGQLASPASPPPISAVMLSAPSGALVSVGLALATIRCLQASARAKPACGLLEEALPGDQRDRVGVLEVVGDLVGREQHVERHDRAAA